MNEFYRSDFSLYLILKCIKFDVAIRTSRS